MAKELNEDTGFNVSLKSLAGIGFIMATIIGMWFTLQADIAEAKAIYAHAEQLSKNNSSKFIGALQASVRPVITYLLFSVFAFVKVTQVIMAVQGGGDVLQGVVAAWDLETQAMFSAVIAFWFGNRMMKSAKK